MQLFGSCSQRSYRALSKVKLRRPQQLFTVMRLTTISVLFLSLIAASSCVTHQEIVSFQQVAQDGKLDRELIQLPELTIQPNDLLRIDINSADVEGSALFNENNGAPQTGAQISLANIQLFLGYLVDANGYVTLPTLGRTKVGGISISTAQATIRKKLETYFENPAVNIRFLNLKVTVLGEVNSPGTVPLGNSRVTLLDALGMAGDLTSYANRTNLLVVREIEGERTTTRLDLQSADLFNSPYFYLRQNDVIYVEPIKSRTATLRDRGQRALPYGTAGVSIIALILTIFLTRN